MMSGIILPDNANNNNQSPLEAASSGGGGGGGDGGVALWLDMRTALLPAAQTLQALYDELRQREDSLGRGPDDPDWSLSRVPNPVGALLYAAEPADRASEEMKALGAGGNGGGGLPCFRLSGTDEARILDASSGDVVGVGLDPAGGGSGGNQAMEMVVAAQQRDSGNLVFLQGARPSVWEDGDMENVLRIATSACAGAGKTLVVSVRSTGQLHDAAMAAFAASQTQILGARPAGGERVSEGNSPAMALLIEPMADLWEAGLLYL